jgi:ABC-type cobalamin/Fe3+-siderophores transport system ATPase subunit
MSLLTLQRVSKRVGDGARSRTVLRDVSLALEGGEYTVVWGMRGSGRSTLLRVAAGVEAPDRGVVCFDGRELGGSGQELGEGIGYCHERFAPGEGRGVLDQVTMGLLARGVPHGDARASAGAAIERCGVADRARCALGELDRAERVRVALARALALSPRLLVIDEPTNGVELMQRDGVLLLLRSIADEGIAVLASAGEPTGLTGADRTLALSDGELHGELICELAPVVPLRRTA